MSEQLSTAQADATAEAGKVRPPARTPAEIEADIERTRQSLAGSVDQLQERVSPAALLGAARDKAMSVVRRPDGSLDPVRTAVVAGAVLLVATYLVRRRRL